MGNKTRPGMCSAKQELYTSAVSLSDVYEIIF